MHLNAIMAVTPLCDWPAGLPTSMLGWHLKWYLSLGLAVKADPSKGSYWTTSHQCHYQFRLQPTELALESSRTVSGYSPPLPD